MLQLLRPRLSNRSVALTSSVLRFSTSEGPSLTTTVMLKKLHPTATQTMLADIVSQTDLRIRKVIIEPGCGVQVANEVQAECVATLLKHEFNCHTTIQGTVLPAVLLKNIPTGISSQDIKSSLAKHDPKGVHITGGVSFECRVESPLDALALAKIVQEVALGGGQTLNAHLYKLGDKMYSIQITNVPSSVTAQEAKAAIEKALSAHSSGINVSATPKRGHVLTVRVPAEAKVDPAKIAEKLAALSTNSCKFTVSDTKALKMPAIFLRNVSKVGKVAVEKTMAEFDIERIQFTYKSKDVVGDLAVVYFKTQAEALSTLKSIKNAIFNGKRLSSSYRETAEPGIVITGLNLQSPADAEEIVQMFSAIDPVYHIVRNNSEIFIVCRDLHDASTASVMAEKFSFHGIPLQAEASGLYDIGFDIVMDKSSTTAPSEEAIRSALEGVGATVKDLTVESNLNAFVTFETLHRATLAQHSMEDGSVSFKNDSSSSTGRLISTVTTYPSNAVAVEGLSDETPVTQISDFLKEHGIRPLCIDRSAILKFKRNMEVVPGMKKLKTLQLGGLQLKPERYRPLNQLIKDPEYDVYGNDEVFDTESLNQTMKDYLHTDPATRLQIARNSFERAVFTAKQQNDSTFLHDENAPVEIQEEIAQLMEAHEPNVERLFELFIQKEDMYKFAYDFRKLTAVFGTAEGPEKDPFNWSSFKIDNNEELMRLREAMRLSQEMAEGKSAKDLNSGKGMSPAQVLKMVDSRREAASAGVAHSDDFEDDDGDNEDDEAGGFAPSKTKAVRTTVDGVEGDDDDLDDISINQVSGEKWKQQRRDFQDDFDEDSSQENLAEITDRNGHVWSGIVIDTDTTQTTLPSGRFMTHRCLVMVGNLKGAGGFGMGKGENSQMAMKRAFRDAVKNVFFVDLYDNYGLAHDLMGKHNACRVYIRATPRERAMVGSPLSRAILNRFGISSASCRVVGRRDPYSVCRAFSYALQNHENLDEHARDRGLRYLTLRWIYDNKI